MTPDPSFLYQTASHREALAALTYGVLEEKGFITVIGDAGTGKTTLLSRMLRTIPRSKVAFSLVLNPTLTAEEFLESAMVDFGIDAIPTSKLRRLLKLQQFLSIARSAGKICVLVIDEAHKLSSDVLEEIRLLTNFENAERKFVQIILAGQLELRSTLNAQELRQLKQRIAVRCELRPLSGAEVAQYVYFRWTVAGGASKPPFDEEAIQFIAAISNGIPRVINALCDNSLALIYATGEPRVAIAHARQGARDLDLEGLESYSATPSQRSGNGYKDTSGHAPLNLPQPVPVRPSTDVLGASSWFRTRKA